MKHYLTCLLLVLSSALSGQIKDRRAELDIDGYVSEISVSPDEKIWLVTSAGNTYFTNSIDSNWHYGRPLVNEVTYKSHNCPILERISFFNSDTAIMTGFFSGTKKESKHEGYYLTKDGGKNWKLYDYGGNSRIYATCVDKYGKAWMGGLHQEVYYSSDFGQSWETIKLPYRKSDRTYGLCMSGPNKGIASSEHNEIVTTNDNWKTVTHLATPLDQKKYQPDESSEFVSDGIYKVLYWNNYIVVNQDRHIFYSDSLNIDWKPLPINLINFEVDSDSKKLFATTESLRVVSFSNPNEFVFLSDECLGGFPSNMKVVNSSLFLLCGHAVYKVNKAVFKYSLAYTTDKKISEPNLVTQGKRLTWGIDRNQIYLAEDNKHKWYRENVLDFHVADIKILSDSLVILWDGKKNNYLYSLKDHVPHLYCAANPIEGFLASPVKSIFISSGNKGCYNRFENKLDYKLKNDSAFSASNYTLNHYYDTKSLSFSNEIQSAALKKVLTFVNTRAQEIPGFMDFLVTGSDIKNYLILIDRVGDKSYMDFRMGRKKPNKVFYQSVPAMLDTLNSSIVTEMFNQRDFGTSTISSWFTINFVNKDNDTLNASVRYYLNPLPWNLPWQVRYKGLTFNCYDIDFSKFVKSLIPDGFIGKEVFDNRFFLRRSLITYTTTVQSGANNWKTTFLIGNNHSLSMRTNT